MNNSSEASACLSSNRPESAETSWHESAVSPDLFEEIYRSHGEFVRRVCLRALRDPIEAEDATQDVFIRVLLKFHTFRGESAFSSWLYRLTMNVVLMRFRKNRKSVNRKSVSLDESAEAQIKAGSGPHAPNSYPGSMAGRIDLETAINHLPSGVRRVLILHDIQGYRHREIAQFLGYSDGNSKCQLHRARIRLRKLLQSEPAGSN